MKKILVLLMISFINTVAAAPVNINTADAPTIAENLKNIGIKKAEAIVAYRTKIGQFKTVEELADVAGIGEKTIEKNRADILLQGTEVSVEKPGVVKESKKK
ncbi:MAG: helix-hairpin-helix domain-containing protein [Methylovulum sp.]|jgi:competence protein ComEA|nr:helix-hairpin-helix domain-containing protein [Methylovulum sp.]